MATLSTFLSGTYSGYSGTSGYSGYSGFSGFSGAIGPQGISGYSGASTSGYSGYSGYSGISGYSGQDGVGGSVSYVKKTANYTALASDAIIADTSGGSFTITLPATPTLGDNITIVDGANWTTNNLIIGRNGSTIEGVSEDLTIDIRSIRLDIVYDGTTWNVITSTGTAEIPDQTGNSGKYLTTNGSSVSWSSVDALPSQSGNDGKYLTTDGSTASWAVLVAGITATDDTTTNTSYYPSLFTATSGSQSSAKVSSTKLYFNPNTGTLSSTNFNSLSDLILKENIVPLNVSIDSINPVEFTWKDNNKKSFGLIAQDVEEIFPHMVETSEEGIKSVSYIQLIPILIKEIKELKEEIKKMKEVK